MVKIDLRPSSISLHFTKHNDDTNDNIRTIGGAIQLSGKVADEPEEKRVEILKDVFGCLLDVFDKENFVVDVISLDDDHQQLYFDFVPDVTSMIGCDRLKQYQDGILNHLQDTYPYLNFQELILNDMDEDEPVLDDMEEDVPMLDNDVEDESDNREDELDEPDDVEDELDQKHDKEASQNHQSLTEPIAYWKIAEEMTNDILLISDRQNSQKERLAAVSRLRENLARCAADKNLDVLTAIYRDTMPTTKVNIGYDQVAASEFITMFRHLYPKPNDAVQHEEDAVSDHESSVNQADVQITEDQKMNKLKIRMAKIEDKLKDRELKDRKTWLKDREDLVEFRELCLDFRELYLEVRKND